MSMKKSTQARLTTAVILLMVLGSGVVLGVALDRQLEGRGFNREDAGGIEARPERDERRRGYDPRSRDPARGMPEARDSTRRRPSMLVDQVGLTEEQKEQVDSIVGYFRDRMQELHEEFGEAYMTRFRELNQMARAEIRGILTDEQRTIYDSLQADWNRRRQERREDSISPPTGTGERDQQ